VLVDQMNSVENLVGGANGDTLVGDSAANVLSGGWGADALWGEGGADVFTYQAYADSNLVGGYDTIADFVSGISKLDLSALATDAAHVVIQSDGQSTSLYVLRSAGSFDSATDLAIGFVGPNAIAMSDIRF
jgi:serralysin